jgi:glycosyltransferase involved in cell wall biosynthesis
LIDLGLIKKNNLVELRKFISALLSREVIFVIGSASKMRKVLSWFLYHFNRRCMKRSLLVVMGGTFAALISKQKTYGKWVSGYKKIYVETNKMRNMLEMCGLGNADVLPNCRPRPTKLLELCPSEAGRLRCIFFSQISREKGADIVLEAAALLRNVLPGLSIDFYGHINDQYKCEFEKTITTIKNVEYKGVFKADGENIYQKLNEYDLLLFPTRWKTEGVPGVLVEAKISALPAIVSNVSFNAEIVEDGVSGVVIDKNDAESLAQTILRLAGDLVLLDNMKKGALESAKHYFADRYIPAVLEQLSLMGGE